MNTNDDIPYNEQANRAVAFCNKLTCGAKDEMVGQPFRLRPWQEKLVRLIFGTFNPDGTRRYRKCLLFICRKNGKTQLAACCALAEFFSGKIGQQILIVAKNRKQAGIMFEMIETMIRHPSAVALAKLVDINKSEKRISYAAKHSFIQVMSSEAGSALGYSPSMILFDEYLTQKDRELWSALTSGTSARSESLTFILSTAGDDRTSPIFDEFERAKKIAADPSINPTYLPILHYASEDEAAGDKWDDEKLWAKCNPALEDYCKLNDLREEAAEARQLPYEERKFRQYHLNQFVDVSEACWIPAATWAKCRLDPFPADSELYGHECYAAVDLAKVSDLTAFSLAFPWSAGGYLIKSWAWIPGDTLRKHEKKDHANYFQWEREGWLKTCPGEVIDYDWLKDDLLKLYELWKPKTVFWDRAGAAYLIQQLSKETNIPMFGFGQGSLSMSQPTKEFERLTLAGKLQHDGNKCLAWCVQNVRLDIATKTELASPHKGRSTGRIDCAFAGIMALAGAMGAQRPDTEIYSDRDALFALLGVVDPKKQTTAPAAPTTQTTILPAVMFELNSQKKATNAPR